MRDGSFSRARSTEISNRTSSPTARWCCGKTTAETALTPVAISSGNATSSALYYLNEDSPVYIYVDSSGNIVRNTVDTKATDGTFENTDLIGESVTLVPVSKFGYDFAGWYVDENLKYEVLYEESYDYDIRLYPAYTVYVLSGN